MEEDEDMHVCLVCNQTITGLLNYVNHKKSECPGRKTAKPVQRTTVTTIGQSQDYTIGTSASYISQSFVTTSQNVFNSGVNFQNQEAVTLLTPQTNISSSLDVFDSAQFPVNTTDGNLQDICLKNAGTEQSLFDPHSADNNPTFGLSPSIFTQSHGNEVTDTSSSKHENHGLLSACLNNAVVADFGNGVNIHIPNSFPMLSSEKSPNPNGEIININDIMSSTHGKSGASNKAATEKVDDFFQSLELMSKTNPKTEKGSSFHQPLLPISNILNNLTFNSDEEDLGFNFADDVSFDSMSETSDDEAPPSEYTGGKWKPGEKPCASKTTFTSHKKKPVFRGKWPPGQVPEQTSAKYYGGRPRGGKNISSLLSAHQKKTKPTKPAKPQSSKSFHCSFCDITFQCRFKYSSHCGSPAHKEKVFGRREPFLIDFGRGLGKAASSKVSKESKSFEEVDDDESNEDIDSNENEIPEASGEQLSDKAVVQTKQELQDSTMEGNDDNSSTTGDRATSEELADSSSLTTVPLQLHICTVCDKKYPSKYLISNHLISKYHRNRVVLNKQAAFELLVKYHRYIVRLSPFQCAICRFYFNKRSCFEDHMVSEEHMENCEEVVGELTCALCKFKTHSHEELLNHLHSADHVGAVSKQNKVCIVKESHVACKCKYCGLTIQSYTKLKYHIQRKHANKEVVTGVTKRQIGVRCHPVCRDCGKQFMSQSALQLHTQRIHSKEKPYKCDLCKIAFACRHDLGKHKNTRKHIVRVCDEEKFRNIAGANDDNLDKAKEPLNMKVNVQGQNKQEVRVGNNCETDLNSTKRQTDSDKLGRNDLETENEPVMKCEQQQLTPRARNSKKQFDDWIEIDTAIENDEMIASDEEWKHEKVARKPTPGYRKQRRDKNKKRKKRGERPAKIHKCDHCSYTANSYNDLRPHYMKEHSTQITTCEVCDQIFLSERAYKVHVTSIDHQKNLNSSGASTSEKYYTCDVCKKQFNDERYCNFHTTYSHYHITTEEALLSANNGKDVTRARYEKLLQEYEVLELVADVKCPECNGTFKNSHFIEHLRTHTGDKPFKCNLCTNAYFSPATLRRHVLGHFIDDATCDICGRQFKKESTFKNHMRMHKCERGELSKGFSCDICGSAFFFEWQLKVHLRRHSKREFACPEPGCHWKFVMASELKYHMMTHTKERRFLCDLCGHAASSRYRLKFHRRIHTGERNFHCEYCTYKAGTKTHLQRHMRIHIGSKPFQCPYCPYACNTFENMRKHIRLTKKHEGKSIYPCKFCNFGTDSASQFRQHLIHMHESQLDNNFYGTSLSSYTGMYNKSLDPDEPEAGKQIYQVRERVQRDNGTSKSKKRDKQKTETLEESRQVEVKQPLNLEKTDSTVKSNTGMTQKKRKRKMQPGENLGMFSHSMTEEDHHGSSRNVHDGNMGKVEPDYCNGNDMLMKSHGQDMSTSYFSCTIGGMGAPPYVFVADNQFKTSIDVSELKAGPQFNFNANADRTLLQVQRSRGNAYEADVKPMTYHDYRHKNRVSGDRDGPGNLIIDMNMHGGK